MAPPPPPGAQPTTTGGLPKLETLSLSHTRITEAGCATLASALDSGALPALRKPAFEHLPLNGIPASAAAKGTVRAALKANVRRAVGTDEVSLERSCWRDAVDLNVST